MSSDFRIPEQELEIRAVRSRGPGGQHVNTSATRVEVRWNVTQSAALSDHQRERLRERLAHRLSKDGVIRVAADDERSQRRNRNLAIERLHALVWDALQEPKTRRPTRPPASAKEARLDDKRRRSETKARRRRLTDDSGD